MKFSCLFGSFCFEVTKQSLQRLLVALVMFPAGKIADRAFTADFGGPSKGTGRDCVVQAKREEDGLLFLAFSCQGGVDFMFDPSACKRVFGENKQEFLVQSDGFIHPMTNTGSPFQILWSTPAANIFPLQVSIQAFSKGLILPGIANQAGVVLAGVSGKGVHVLKEGVRCASSFHKHLWNIALRQVDAVDTQWRWTRVQNGVQPLDASEISITERGIRCASSAEVGSEEVGSSQADSSQVGSSQVDKAEVGSAEVGSAEVSSSQVGSSQVGSAEVGSEEVGIAKVSSAEVGSSQVGSEEVGIAEVGSTEFNVDLRMFPSPGIPGFYSLFQKVKLLLICHALFSSLGALSIEKGTLFRKFQPSAKMAALMLCHERRKCLMDEGTYDVALWRFWPGELVPYTDLVKGPSPLVAALRLMARYKLVYVAHVKVACPDGSIWSPGTKGLSRVDDGEIWGLARPDRVPLREEGAD